MHFCRLLILAPLFAGILLASCHRRYDGVIEEFRCSEEGVFGPPACDVGMTCVAGKCVDIGVPFGHFCDDDVMCPSGSRCLDPATFGAEGEPRCSRLCCSSTDCGPHDEGMVCHFPAGATGGYCWPAEELGREAAGEGRVGSDCSEGSACRSGVCTAGQCEGACCGDAYCNGELVCRVRLSDVAEEAGFSCGAPGGPMQQGLCDSDDDCVSGKCVAGDEMGMYGICAAPCCSSTECTEVLINAVSRPVACDTTADGLRACSRIMFTDSTRPLGAPCDDSDDCRSGLCLKAGSVTICSDSCCDDESCGDTSAFACRPMMEETTWALRCVPK